MNEVYEAFEEKTVLVTGGVGAVGVNLVKKLDELDVAKIVIIDDLSSSFEWNIPKGDKIRFIRGDILDENKLKKAFEPKRDIVYHLAAHFANQNSVDHPEKNLMVNGLGTLRILETARLADVEFRKASPKAQRGYKQTLTFLEGVCPAFGAFPLLLRRGASQDESWS